MTCRRDPVKSVRGRCSWTVRSESSPTIASPRLGPPNGDPAHGPEGDRSILKLRDTLKATRDKMNVDTYLATWILGYEKIGNLYPTSSTPRSAEKRRARVRWLGGDTRGKIEAEALDRHAGGGLEIELGHPAKPEALVEPHGRPHHVGGMEG
jgi:hypothetical protein